VKKKNLYGTLEMKNQNGKNKYSSRLDHFLSDVKIDLKRYLDLDEKDVITFHLRDKEGKRIKSSQYQINIEINKCIKP